MKILVSVGAEHSQQMRLRLLAFKELASSVSNDFAKSKVEVSSERSVKIIFNQDLVSEEIDKLSSRLTDEIVKEFNFAKGFITISLV